VSTPPGSRIRRRGPGTWSGWVTLGHDPFSIDRELFKPNVLEEPGGDIHYGCGWVSLRTNHGRAAWHNGGNGWSYGPRLTTPPLIVRCPLRCDRQLDRAVVSFETRFSLAGSRS
jgi:hypothetical protein